MEAAAKVVVVVSGQVRGPAGRVENRELPDQPAQLQVGRQRMDPLHEGEVRQVGQRLVEDAELGEAQVPLLREAVQRVQGDPPRDGLSGQLLDLPADPVVDVLEDAYRELRPGVAGQYRRDEAGIELRRRLGPIRLLHPSQRDRLVSGEVLGRQQGA